MAFVFIFMALCLFIFAPAGYSLSFCLVCAVMYIVLASLTLSREVKDKTYFSFNLLFWLSMFCTTFIVPLFVLPLGLRSGLDDQANKCTAMVVLAMSIYFLAWQRAYNKKLVPGSETKRSIFVPRKVLSVMRVFTILVTILYFYQYAMFMRTSTIYDNDIGLGFTYTLIQAILCSSLVVSCIYHRGTTKSLVSFLGDNGVVLVCYAIIIITSIIVGDRTMPIYLSICILSSYIIYVRKLNLVMQWGLIIVAAAVMVTIGKTRHSDDNFREGGAGSIASTTIQTIGSAENTVDLFSDFLPATSALYACSDWRDRNNGQLFYPLKILKTPFAPLPYVPTLISRYFFGVENDELSSASLTTSHFSQYVMQINGGLGTHAVGDIYVSWGLVGIFVFFYLLGLVLGTAQRRVYDNVFWALTYIALLCNALYIPRASIFDNYRAIMFEFFFIWLAGIFAGNPVKTIIEKK